MELKIFISRAQPKSFPQNKLVEDLLKVAYNVSKNNVLAYNNHVMLYKNTPFKVR